MTFQLLLSCVLIGFALVSAQNQKTSKDEHESTEFGYSKSNMNHGYAIQGYNSHNYGQMFKQAIHNKHGQNGYKHRQGRQQHINQHKPTIKYYGYNHGQDLENFGSNHGQDFAYNGYKHGQGFGKDFDHQVERFEKSTFNKEGEIQENVYHYGYQQPTPKGNAKVYVHVRQVFQDPTRLSYKKPAPPSFSSKNPFSIKHLGSAQVFQPFSMQVAKQMPYPVKKKTPVPVKPPSKVPYSVKTTEPVQKSYPATFTKNVPYIGHQLNNVEKKVPVFVKDQYNGQGYAFGKQNTDPFGEQFKDGYEKQNNNGYGLQFGADFGQHYGNSFGLKYGDGFDNEYENDNDDQYGDIFKQFYQQHY